MPVNGQRLLDVIKPSLENCRVCLNIALEDKQEILQQGQIPPSWELLIEAERQGNGSAIKTFLTRFHPTENFYVQHCDVVCSQPASELLAGISQWIGWNVFVKDIAEQKSWGIFVPEGSGEQFPTKATGFTRRRLINTGIYAIHPKISDWLPAGAIDIDRDIFPKLTGSQKLYLYNLPGQWTDYGTEDKLSELFAHATS